MKYRLNKSGPLTIENNNVLDGADNDVTIDAIEGTVFDAVYIPSEATKDMGDLVLENGYCIPLVSKNLFSKI
jgi:hypothetical protein